MTRILLITLKLTITSNFFINFSKYDNKKEIELDFEDKFFQEVEETPENQLKGYTGEIDY